MTSMREKLASKLFKAQHGYEAAENLFAGPYADMGPIGKAMMLADAALDALMEPTEGMIDEGQNEVNLLEAPDPPNAFEFLSTDEVTSIWQAMVAAAKEGK